MKFVIYREIEGRRKTLVEWDQRAIEDGLIKNTKQYLITHPPEEAVYFAFKKLIEDFKKETVKIP